MTEHRRIIKREEGHQITNITQSDFIYFKNELLKELKLVETKITKKIDFNKNDFNEKIRNNENQINAIKTKLIEFSSSKTQEQIQMEKIDKLFDFRTNIEGKMSSLEMQTKTWITNSNESFSKINKKIRDNLMYPGLIGVNAKFTNFRNFIDYVLSNLNLLLTFKEKMTILDMQSYKTKLEKISENYTCEVDNLINNSKKIYEDCIISFNKRINELISLFNGKLIHEKDEREDKINSVYDKIGQVNRYIISIREELMSKIENNSNENKEFLVDSRAKVEKSISDIEAALKKVEKMKEFFLNKNTELEEKMKILEHKLIVKMSHLYAIIKDLNNELTRTFKSLSIMGKDIHYNYLHFEKLIDRNIKDINYIQAEINHNIEFKPSNPVGSILKKYIDGEIGLNEFLHETRSKKMKYQNSRKKNVKQYLNDSDYKIKDNKNSNKLYQKIMNDFNNNIHNNNNSYKNNKYFKESRKNNSEDYNTIHKRRNCLYKAHMNNENSVSFKNPKNQLIQSILMGNNDPISYYSMISRLEHIYPFIKSNKEPSHKISIIKNYKKQKSENNINNNEPQFNSCIANNYNDQKNNQIKNNTDDDIKEHNYQNKSKINSSHNTKSRNNDIRPASYTSSEIMKNDSKTSMSPGKENKKDNQNKLLISSAKIKFDKIKEKNIINSYRRNSDNSSFRLKNENNKNCLKSDRRTNSSKNYYRSIKLKKNNKIK